MNLATVGDSSMAKKSKKKRQIEQYDHSDKTRANNPPVGLVTPATDKDEGKKTYQYDPHIDPALQFDSQGSEVENIIDEGLAAVTSAADDPEELQVALAAARKSLEQLKDRRKPYLNWAGKAERTSFEVDTVSLHVHERIDPRTIVEAVRKQNGSGDGQMLMFEQPDENLPLRQAIEFYQHEHNWSNRMVAGDSLLVMNSLLEKEGMAGKVQMVYIDPPYGIRYGSNFQPFVNRRDVKDGKDEDLTQEPEMLKAFRDTWELGIHSYLTYLRDRLLLARELLTESGSVFVQIGDENLHIARGLLDEVFGHENYLTTISFVTTTGTTGEHLPKVENYLIGYCRTRGKEKYRQLYSEKNGKSGSGPYSWIETQDGTRRRMTRGERERVVPLPDHARVFRLDNLQSQSGGRAKGDGAACWFRVEYDGMNFKPSMQSTWKTNEAGMALLKAARRFQRTTNALYYVRFLNDFPVQPLNNAWGDTVTAGFASDKRYVVETNTKVVERCLLMTTDPGDLVLDPTCGSGTMAYVAEQWGRRWITCDTSRVAVTLAKQRLMTAVFDYFKLAHPDEGIGSGFLYKTVPHVTLKSIANNPEIKEGMSQKQIEKAIKKYSDQETLYDQPEIDKSKARVTGPFTVEAVPAAAVRPIQTITESSPLQTDAQPLITGMPDPDPRTRLSLSTDKSITRYGETARQAEWRGELAKTGIRGKQKQRIEFSRVEPLGGTRWLHVDAETKDDAHDRAVISFGPEHAPLEQRQVELALEEAGSLKPTPKLVIFAAFQFDPEASKDIDETNWPGITILKAQMNADLLTDDLKKKRASNESYWLIGQPDVLIKRHTKGEHKGKYQVEVLGFDYYNTAKGKIESGNTTNINIWMLDTDYDGRSLYPRQVFFPMAGPKGGWSRLAKNLKSEIDEELIEQYRGAVSLPFEAGDHRRVAVKIIDDRGIESLKIEGLD